MIYGTLFCSECDDVVYDPRFDFVLQQERGRSHVPRTDEATLDAMLMNDATRADGTKLPSVCRTPRGLRNMGSTCFLNVILQAFLHNPLLRNYFLSDRHNAALCSAGRDCLACEMDKLFAEFFAGGDRREPYGPTSFLYAIWTDSSSELSQAGQHDAHEMFISALNGIHDALTHHAPRRTRLPAFPLDPPDAINQLATHADSAPRASCPCIVHRTFGGMLQSSVTCLHCHEATHTREPFLDLSLEVRADPSRPDDAFKKRDKKRQATAPTLHASLARYCAPEHLPDASYKCSHCQTTARVRALPATTPDTGHQAAGTADSSADAIDPAQGTVYTAHDSRSATKTQPRSTRAYSSRCTSTCATAASPRATSLTKRAIHWHTPTTSSRSSYTKAHSRQAIIPTFRGGAGSGTATTTTCLLYTSPSPRDRG